MNKKSMIETAIAILTENGDKMKFTDLWAEVVKRLEMSEEEILHYNRLGHFYTDLSVSGMVVNVGENNWDLRSRCTFSQVKMDTTDFYTDADEHDDDVSDIEENLAYDASVRGGMVEEKDSYEDDDEGDGKNRDGGDIEGF